MIPDLRNILITSGAVLLLFGCFPGQKQVTMENRSIPDSFPSDMFINTPVKLVLTDSSVVVYERGFSIWENNVHGSGRQYRIGEDPSDEELHVIPLDRIATMAYYDENYTSGMILGSIVMGITGVVMLPYSFQCIANPKSCFGSCPTVYTLSDGTYHLNAELFSYSLSRFYQETDYDWLGPVQTPDTAYTLRVTNEALETHYINQFHLIGIHHPPGTDAWPDPDGRAVIVNSKLREPVSAVDSRGRDILPLIRQKDNLWHMGDTTRLRDFKTTSDNDWLLLSFEVPQDAESVNLVLRVRNTLLTTVLFYDVVLASQGIRAMEWTQRLNTDSLYATLYHTMYSQFAGVRLKVKDGDRWVAAGRIGDVGPIAWKELALTLPVHADSNGIMQVRLDWFPDNFMIDFIGFDTGSANAKSGTVSMEMIPPGSITSYLGEDVTHVWEKIRQTGTDYLVTLPGDHYYFEYAIPDKPGLKTTLMLKSVGYYTEWIRGDWISKPEGEYRFNLFAVDETLEQLKKSWHENRHLLEKTFFETRIPLRESQ